MLHGVFPLAGSCLMLGVWCLEPVPEHQEDHPMTAYEPKNILITGGAGFIASHVAEHLFFKYPKYKMLGMLETTPGEAALLCQNRSKA